MKHFVGYLQATCIGLLVLSACMEYGPLEEEDFNLPVGEGLFITNEGNFGYGSATLSFYLPEEKIIENEVFVRANGYPLGDVAQSMTIYNNLGYIVVNNSGVVYVVDITTFKVRYRIENLTSPRYIHFVNNNKAYITDLYDPRITVIDPATHQVTGYIDTKGHDSTERMIQYGSYVFTNCWSYDNTILIIDTATDEVVDTIEVGIQPVALVIDKNNKIWVLTDGGYQGSPYGYEAPALYRIDAATRHIEKEFRFTLGDSPGDIQLNGTKDTLYFINNAVWRMDVSADRLPVRPFIEYKETRYYGLTVDPNSSDVYVADALDYSQPGIIYRYTADALPVDTFRVGVIPGSFCFR